MATTVPDASPRAFPPWVRLLAVPVVVVVFLLGLWVTAGLITDDFKASMGLTAAWVASCAAAAFVVSRRWPSLRLPVGGTLAAVVALVFGYLTLTTFNDKTVNEVVAQVSPAGGNAEIARGEFSGVAHSTSGTAAIVELASGERVLTLTNFETDAGPDLFVYLGTGTESGELGDSVQLAGLKGNKGNQQYTVRADIDLGAYTKVVIWCRAFSVNFGEAPLATS